MAIYGTPKQQRLGTGPATGERPVGQPAQQQVKDYYARESAAAAAQPGVHRPGGAK